MKTAVEFYGHIKAPDTYNELLGGIREWLDRWPPNHFDPPDELWSCHVVVRAVTAKWELFTMGWQTCDGYFSGNYRHSWLRKDDLILDVYPVASFGGPIIVHAALMSPWQTKYQKQSLLHGLDGVVEQTRWILENVG